MPEISLWGLICSLVLLTIGITLKTVEISHSLKFANDEIARLRKQIEMIEEENNKLALDTGNTNSISTDIHNKLLIFNENTGTWFDEVSSLHYCAKCKVQEKLSPMKNDKFGWKCPACKTYFPDPNRPMPVVKRPGYPNPFARHP